MISKYAEHMWNLSGEHVMFVSKLPRAIYFLLNHEQYSQLLEQCSFSTQSYFVFIFSYSLAEPIKLKKTKLIKMSKINNSIENNTLQWRKQNFVESHLFWWIRLIMETLLLKFTLKTYLQIPLFHNQHELQINRYLLSKHSELFNEISFHKEIYQKFDLYCQYHLQFRNSCSTKISHYLCNGHF